MWYNRRKYARKLLIVHMDKYAGSGPVTEQEIRDIIENRVPGAALGRKYKLKIIKRKKDGEIIKIYIYFCRSVENGIMEQVKTDILVLAGVLEGGVGDKFPIRADTCSDDFELYTPAGTDILASNQNPDGPDWQLELNDVNDPNNLSTFVSTEDGVRAGDQAAHLKLPGESVNTYAKIKSGFVSSNEAKSIRTTVTMSLPKDPLYGKAEINIPKVCDIIVYGSKFFSAEEADVVLNNKIVVLSKDGVSIKKTVFGIVFYDITTGVSPKYEFDIIAEVDGLYFDIILKSVDHEPLVNDMPNPLNICAYQENLTQLIGVTEADMQSGELGLSAKVQKSHNQASEGGKFDIIYAGDENHWNLGVPGPFAGKTAIELNLMQPDVGSYLEPFKLADRLTTTPESAWTLEFFRKHNGAQSNSRFASYGNREPGGCEFFTLTNGDFRIYMKNAAGQLGDCRFNMLLSDSNWHHYCMVGDGTNIKGYRDGVLFGTYSGNASDWVPNLIPAYDAFHTLNWWGGGPNGLNNIHFAEFRYSKVARYTSDFAVPTAQFENDADTIVLFHFDEDYEGAGVLTAVVQDEAAGDPVPVPYTDQEAIIDEMNVVVDG